MRHAVLVRGLSTPSGTFGRLSNDGGGLYYSGELLWDDNLDNLSCIPDGDYPVVWGASNRWGECYRVCNVPGRSGIEIHVANWMGQKSRGMKCDLEGCIALGLGLGLVEGQAGLIASEPAIGGLIKDMNKEGFLLSVRWAPGCEPQRVADQA